MGLLVVAVVGAVIYSVLPKSRDAAPTAEAAGSESPTSDEASASRVQLSPEKAAAAGLHTTEAAVRPLQYELTLPGNLDYDRTRHLELRVPVACMVKQVLVTPGQTVRAGEPLARLTSGEVGRARSAVLKCESDLALARKEFEWIGEISANIEELLAFLQDQPEMSEVEKRFADRPLGEHRDELLPAYSRMQLAANLIESGSELTDRGLLSDRTIRERRSSLEVARAEFQGHREHVLRDAWMEKMQAEAAVAEADRLLNISRENLQALLGPYSEPATNDKEAEKEAMNDFLLRSPLDGRVDQALVVAAMQVEANESLFAVANVEVLWATAQVLERDWAAVTATPGQAVKIRSPALPGRDFAGRVKFIGGRVSPQTRSVPLVAELENADGVLKPGMFVWVAVDVGQVRDALAVPASSLLRHEQQAFVFVAEGPNAFQRVDVNTGLETPDWIEITRGLRAGQSIVDQGAFYLKSELLLEREEE